MWGPEALKLLPQLNPKANSTGFPDSTQRKRDASEDETNQHLQDQHLMSLEIEE